MDKNELVNDNYIRFEDLLTVNPLQSSATQTVSFSASPTPLESSLRNLLHDETNTSKTKQISST